jgi:hypothetical protein
VRADQFGIRATLPLKPSVIKFEIVCWTIRDALRAVSKRCE